tara:strand:- start:58 stop:435 length:378 start_codon:yes stop_codon:yes gene_type:complete
MTRARFLTLPLLIPILGSANDSPDHPRPIHIRSHKKSHSYPVEDGLYELTASGQKLLEAILNRTPDKSLDGPVPLEPSASMVLNDELYALEEHSIILLGSQTKIWEQKDIQKTLFRNSRVVKREP